VSVSPRPHAKLQLKARLLPLLVCLLVALQLTVPYRGWVMGLVVLGGLWLICYVWARALARNLDLQRDMRFGWTQVGDRLEERFTLINRGDMPALWVEIRDHSSMPGYDTSRGTGVSGRSQVEWRTDGVCARRGVFTLGPTSLQTGDPFGLYSVSLTFTASESLLVMPPIIPLPSIDVAPGGRAGEGRPRANAPERTVSVAGVRDYAPGDSARWVHWPTTARRNALYVRTFESTPASDWWIILDMDRATQAGEGQDSALEHAVTLAASLADRGVRDGKQVGLLAHGDELVWLPPRGSDAQRWSILRAMALLDPGGLPLRDLLAHMRPAIGQHASLVLITANTSGGWIEELMLLMRRGAVPTVLLLDAAAYAPDRADGSAQAAVAMLSHLGVACYLIKPDLFTRPEARPGHLGQWDWQTLPTGMVVPVGQPQNASWRRLS
jgi:uncharacterized protein (DUF58 family)